MKREKLIKIVTVLLIIFIILMILGLFGNNGKSNKEIYAFNENKVVNHITSTFSIKNKKNSLDKLFPNESYIIGIKYDVKKGKVNKAYLCFKTTDKEYCLDPNGNEKDNYKIMQQAITKESEETWCNKKEKGYECVYEDALKVEIYEKGIHACEGGSPSDCDDSNSCFVLKNGISYCHIW